GGRLVHTEVVRDDVHHQAQLVGPARRAKGAQCVDPAEFGRDGGGVHDVVAVGGTGSGGHDGREVHRAHAEVGQVGHELLGVGQGEASAVGVRGGGAQLEAVGARQRGAPGR